MIVNKQGYLDEFKKLTIVQDASETSQAEKEEKSNKLDKQDNKSVNQIKNNKENFNNMRKKSMTSVLKVDPWQKSEDVSANNSSNISSTIYPILKPVYETNQANLKFIDFNNNIEYDRKYSLELESSEVERIYEEVSKFDDIEDKTTSSFINTARPSLSFDEENFELHFSLPPSQPQIQQQNKSLDLRSTYLTKLIYYNVWKPDSESNSRQYYNSIIIFDWDDTLFCTSYIFPNNKFRKLSNKDLEELKQLQQCVLKILNYFKEKGDLFIITNANPDWIHFSAKTFFPQVDEILKKKIRVVSARQEFENEFPGDQRQWKISAFQKIKNLYSTDKLTNIMSFGDSEYELEAAYKLGAFFKEVFIKTIKFKKEPLLSELIKQQKLIIKSKEEIESSSKNLLIQVEKKGKKEEK